MTYLNPILQETTHNHKWSEFICFINGVPQGSVLDLLLFLIYITDLEHATVHHFADDTNLLYPSSSLKAINV